MTDLSGPHANRTKWRKALVWVATTVLTSVLGIAVTLNVDTIKNWFSEQEPLEYHVTGTEGSGYSFIVSDPSRLPPDVGKVKDCDPLQAIARAAGGFQIQTEPRYRVLLRGIAKTGIDIIDIRAKVTRRAPAIDGALLTCPGQGAAEPTDLSFNLANSDSAPAQRYDNNSTKVVNQFADGFVISIAENESVSLMIETALPKESIWWHIEADVIVGGHRRTIVVDNEGKDFYSPGFLGLDQYSKGYAAGAFRFNWGIDKDVKRIHGSNGAEALQLGPVVVPYLSGLDFYQPFNLLQFSTSEGDSPYRWVRRDRRKLFVYNPPGTPAIEFPKIRDFCLLPGSNGYPSASGLVRTSTVVSSGVREHGVEQFGYWTIDYQCNLDSLPQYGGHNGRSSASDDWWKCGNVLCPEVTIRFQATRMVGSEILFITVSNQVDRDDEALAERLLAAVEVNP